LEALILIGRTAVLWLTALIVFRLMGKRTLGKMGPFDFAVAIMIGEAVALGMETSTPLYHAIVVTVMLGVLQWGLTWLNLRFRWLERLTQGTPTLIVVDGKADKDKLNEVRVSEADLAMELRQNDMTLKDVKEARLEPSGKISFLKKKQQPNSSSSNGNASKKRSGQGGS